MNVPNKEVLFLKFSPPNFAETVGSYCSDIFTTSTRPVILFLNNNIPS
jgi:hypothetical protein